VSEDQTDNNPETVETAEAVETVDAAAPVESEAQPPALPAPHRDKLTLFTAAALVISTLLAGSVYWFVFRPDQLTNQAARDDVLSAAKSGTEALLTYSPETVDKDLANAKSRLTGDFQKEYSDRVDQTVVPAAKQAGVKTEASVTRAAVAQMAPGRAQVLVFVNQVTTSRARPTPALATSSIMLTLVERDGHWLISDFKPI
jgi:Mce-associated membrane protein